MAEREDIWIPLVDEPIGTIVSRIQNEDPEIQRLIGTPHRILAFRTFAYIRVGVVLGQLLVDNEVPEYDRDGGETWIESLLRDPRHREAVAAEVRAVAREIADDPSYGDEEPLGPDDATRQRFLEFARKQSD
jgi:hypothetical protein